ncbi:hypothetical protein E3N88_10410 [Mikania micrantha]|uniref:Uncharacterized protein n=1 Tax=Mikania micrantha TaxID=192012 RepID=A0A5N6PBN9_9ASTR|nr:hypothetical protein E3N88_10410 [Mikania micrantha]
MDVFGLNGRGIGKKEVHILPSILMEKAIWFILNNCQEVQPFLEEHLLVLQSKHPQSSDYSKLQKSTFLDWFAKRTRDMYTQNPSQLNEELYALSSLPDNRVSSHRGYIVNGVKYVVKSRDDCRQTQNCGVTVPGIHNDVEDDYYGYLDDVIELSFIRDINLVREDIADEIVENVDVRGSDANKDYFIDDEIDNSDYSMEDFGSELNLYDSETDTHNIDPKIVESDDDDEDDDDRGQSRRWGLRQRGLMIASAKPHVPGIPYVTHSLCQASATARTPMGWMHKAGLGLLGAGQWAEEGQLP